MLRVAVGSRNPAKIEAVQKIFSKLYEDMPLEVNGVETPSGVPAQPFGEETIEGAVNRAKSALEKTNADIGVGVEAGLFKFPYTLTGYLDIQWCAIIDREGRLTVGCNSGFEQPPEVIEHVLKEKREIGEVMEKLTGINRLGNGVGAVGVLSKGKLTRKELTEQAVLMAMIPRLNEKIYFEN